MFTAKVTLIALLKLKYFTILKLFHKHLFLVTNVGVLKQIKPWKYTNWFILISRCLQLAPNVSHQKK